MFRRQGFGFFEAGNLLVATVATKEIKKHCLEQLAKFKVPNIIKIVKSIPKGPTGKLQRNKMAKLLGLEK